MAYFPIPSYTCSAIDDIKSDLEVADYRISDVLDAMEGIRKDNATLREAAEGYKAETERLEEQVKELEQEIAELLAGDWVIW